jgi:hypothetical protein
VTFGSTRAATTARSTLTVGAALAISASLLMAPGTAQAVTAQATAPAGTPTLKSLGITSQVRDMVVAGGKVWVSSANQVDVFSTAGARLTSVTGLLGAADLIASADGTSVYVSVSQDSRIAGLNTTSMAQTSTWTTSACPTHLALAAGRLFYAFGCATTQGAIGSVDPANGSAGPVVAESLYYPPWLGGGGSTLVAIVLGLSPGTANSYTVNADGTVTALGSAQISTSGDFAVSPDGGQVIMTGGYQELRRYHSSDLAVAGTFATTGWTRAVAYTADGSHFAGAAQLGQLDMVRVFDNSSGSLTSRSAGTPTNGALPTVIAGTLQFSADGKRLYGVTQDTDAVAKLVTATAQSVSAGRIAATVSSPSAYGKKGSVRVTAGRARTKVTVTATANGTTRSVSKISNAAGTVSIPLSAKYSGTLTVTLAGDLRHSAVTSSAKAFRVPAKLGLAVTGAYSTRGGLQHFHDMSKVKVIIRVSPARSLTATYTLQAKIAGRWTAVSSGTYSSRGDNTDYLYLASAKKRVQYRFVGKFAGDGYNSKAPTATSKTIIID